MSNVRSYNVAIMSVSVTVICLSNTGQSVSVNSLTAQIYGDLALTVTIVKYLMLVSLYSWCPYTAALHLQAVRSNGGYCFVIIGFLLHIIFYYFLSLICKKKTV